MWRRHVARCGSNGCSNAKELLPFSTKAVLTCQVSSLLSIFPGKTCFLDGGWRSKRISPNTPGVHNSALCSPLMSDQITENLITTSPVSLLSLFLSLSFCFSGGKKKKKKKSGFSQPWESFSCQREKLNELVVERNMPCLFKPRLNPGCLIVSNIPQLPPTLERVSSVNCPVREPGCLATQAKGGQSQLLVTLDPKLNTEKSMSSGYGAHRCWPTTQKSHTESMQAKSSLEKHIA